MPPVVASSTRDIPTQSLKPAEMSDERVENEGGRNELTASTLGGGGRKRKIK